MALASKSLHCFDCCCCIDDFAPKLGRQKVDIDRQTEQEWFFSSADAIFLSVVLVAYSLSPIVAHCKAVSPAAAFMAD